MLEIKFVRNNLTEVKTALSNRGGSADFEMFESSDQHRRTILFEIEDLRHRRNVVTDEIAAMKNAGEDAEALIVEMRQVSTRIKELDKTLSEDAEKIDAFLLGLPNIPHESVPVGKDETDNPVEKKIGEPPVFDFEPKAHWEIGNHLGILDFDRGQDHRSPLFPFPRRRRQTRACADQFYARHPDNRTRLHGNSTALHGQCKKYDQHGTTA